MGKATVYLDEDPHQALRLKSAVELQQRIGHDFSQFPVGAYRVVSKVHDCELVSVVVKVGHRRDVYRS